MITVSEKFVSIPSSKDNLNILEYLVDVEKKLSSQGKIVRFIINGIEDNLYECELGIINGDNLDTSHSLFEFKKRKVSNQEKFNVAFIVPTGIGAEIGGHAGDAAPAAKLLASVSDLLITHPNVVNASDINEMPENGLYVEGSVLSRLLMGTIGLEKRKSNSILVIVEAHPEWEIRDWTINAVNAARASCGFNCSQIVMLSPSFEMKASLSENGKAIGTVYHLERIFEVLDSYKNNFDAVALTSVIDYPLSSTVDYFQGYGSEVNPWGGVEAMLTHAISTVYDIPTAHSPQANCIDWLTLAAEKLDNSSRLANGLGIVEPAIAAEAVSMTYLQCILKGLHRSPGIVSDPAGMQHHSIITSADISCLVQPDRCIGLPTLAALENEIPVIAIKDKTNILRNDLNQLPWGLNQLHFAENYLEAAGILSALKTGISLESVKRPLLHTPVMDT